MRPILIDTNAYSAFMVGNAEIVDVIAHSERLFLNTIVLGELLSGFAAGAREAQNRSTLTRFMSSPRVDTLALTSNTADAYALIYAELRRKGQPIPTNDLWIAASAMEHGLALLSCDAHFSHIAGLRVGRRIEDFIP